LAFSSHLIAVGRFEGVLRYNRIPLGSSTAQQQSILYAFRVEQYLKGNSDYVIKIRQSGGLLPWSYPKMGISGVGFQIEDDAIPIIDQRYIVFLKDPKKQFPAFIEPGFASMKRGDTSSILFYMDEFSFSDSLRGKIWLQNGKTFPLLMDNKPLDWSFDYGEQILGLTEKDAIDRIVQEVAAEERRQEKYNRN
jgi:hypothetical protein